MVLERVSVTSVTAARWLEARKFMPQLVFLDSAHEPDETYIELCLYWNLLPSGGILMGDDLFWDAVREDVLRFIMERKLYNNFGFFFGGLDGQGKKKWKWEWFQYPTFHYHMMEIAGVVQDKWWIQKP